MGRQCQIRSSTIRDHGPAGRTGDRRPPSGSGIASEIGSIRAVYPRPVALAGRTRDEGNKPRGHAFAPHPEPRNTGPWNSKQIVRGGCGQARDTPETANL